MKKCSNQIANVVTSFRVAFSLVLLFTKVFSKEFFVLYILSGLTDILDGFIARKMNIQSELGSKLDTIADVIFTLVVMIKILPTISLPLWLIGAIIVIAIIKLMNIFRCYKITGKFLSVHSTLNKITGALLFILPLTLSTIDIRYSGTMVCIIALMASINERISIDHNAAS